MLNSYLQTYHCSYKPITALINQSLTTGVFPEKLKTAKVVPIFKKDDIHCFNNYRPISLLPAISKIYEKIVHVQLFDYFTSNNLFYANQYGFRTKFSTEHAVLDFVDRLYTNLDANNTPFTLFLDFSKAFDTIDHTILLNKLIYYRINNIELKWFNSYLSNRTQYVTINNTDSLKLNIRTGVPQGSILGPLLFLIYINDLNQASIFEPILYADGTTLVSSLCTF